MTYERFYRREITKLINHTNHRISFLGVQTIEMTSTIQDLKMLSESVFTLSNDKSGRSVLNQAMKVIRLKVFKF